MHNNIQTNHIFLLAAIFFAGMISITIKTSFAEPEYYLYEEEYVKDPYAIKEQHVEEPPYMNSYDDRILFPKDSHANDKHENSNVDVQELSCINSNVNVNGIDIKRTPVTGGTSTQIQQLGDDINGIDRINELLDNGINIDRNLVNICTNMNLNWQIDGGFLGGFFG